MSRLTIQRPWSDLHLASVLVVLAVSLCTSLLGALIAYAAAHHSLMYVVGAVLSRGNRRPSSSPYQ